MATMEERPPMDYREDEIDLSIYFAILRKAWWKIGLFSISGGIVTLLVMLRMPNIYQATAVITPQIEEGSPGSPFGALATFGLSGAPTKADELELLLNSKDFAVRVVNKYNLWPVLLGDRYDPVTGKMKASGKGGLWGGGKEPKPLGDWDAIGALRSGLRVSANKKANTVTISYESPSAEGSANIVKCVLEGAKNRLQEETFERATRNKKFIEEQIGKTMDALTRSRLYVLYGQEVEREMMARNREQFGFRVVESPRVPNVKFKPHRAQGAILATVLSFIVGCVFFIAYGIIGSKKKDGMKQAEIS